MVAPIRYGPNSSPFSFEADIRKALESKGVVLPALTDRAKYVAPCAAGGAGEAEIKKAAGLCCLNMRAGEWECEWVSAVGGVEVGGRPPSLSTAN
jgi:hypothetical protein